MKNKQSKTKLSLDFQKHKNQWILTVNLNRKGKNIYSYIIILYILYDLLCKSYVIHTFLHN